MFRRSACDAAKEIPKLKLFKVKRVYIHIVDQNSKNIALACIRLFLSNLREVNAVFVLGKLIITPAAFFTPRHYSSNDDIINVHYSSINDPELLIRSKCLGFY
jgi:hypothetical protein